MWSRNQLVLPLSFLFLYWLLFNYLVFLSPVTWFSKPDSNAISTVQYQVSAASQTSDLDEQDWHDGVLPDDWYHSQHDGEQLWYRATLNLPHEGNHKTIDNSHDIWAVYLPQVTHNAAVYINDVWVGQGGAFADDSQGKALARNHNTPLFFPFSSDLLQKGVNQVDIRVAATISDQGLFDAFYIAPEAELRDAYEWKYFVRVTFMQWVTITMVMMGLIVFAFWLARPQDKIYGLFSLELLFWATHNLNLNIIDIPLPVTIWEAMVMSTLGWTVITMIMFNHRYINEVHPKIEKFILAFAILGVGIFFLPDLETILSLGYRIWDSFLLLFGTYSIYFLVQAYIKHRDRDIFLMILVGIPILVSGFHDILVVNHHWNRLDGLIIQYSVVPAVILFSWFLLRRFVQSINKAEHLAETLEIRVRKKEKTLKQQYDQLRELEKQQVLTEERNRIMRDMHDGIGGQLVSIIAMLRDKDGDIFSHAREKIQHSLTDLRFVIDSLDPVMNDLPTLLGTLRMRMREQLENSGIELEWAVTELPVVKTMTPRHNLHIMRIVQEAITNSIKHSGTKKMKLATGLLPPDTSACNEHGEESADRIFIDIIDYGKGIQATESHSGRGIENMQYRAQQANAELLIQSIDNGTRIRLLLAT